MFIGDGLRADKAFQCFPEPYPKSDDDLVPRHLAPFLRSRVLEHGTFGVSHTRVPTESRPGHVALIAGLYEDVSAVTTGWKLNPVNFDSVFNRSRHTWSWGSPDILPMFEKGAVAGRVDAFTYGADMEDNSRDATHLDLWVFDHVKEFFSSAAQNKIFDFELRQDRVVFFLHLLGLDTTGHSYRPYSKEYLHNIKVVDQGVGEIVDLFENFFGDSRTAYVFTADHGMSDWGSHGDGHPDNTRTPLVVWGSGVSGPVSATSGSLIAAGHDAYSMDWGLSHVARHDVAQADIAPLMAYLVGIEAPANSVGELPLSYLAASSEDKAKAALVNARNILEIYRVKEAKKQATELRYRQFPLLRGSSQSPETRVRKIQQLILERKFEESIEESAALLKLGLEGIRYLQTYDWLFLRALVTTGYLGWIAFALTVVIDLHVLQTNIPPSRSVFSTSMSLAVLAAMYASFIACSSPLTYYGYALFPVAFWEAVYARRRSLCEGKKILTEQLVSSAGGKGIGLILGCLLFLATLLSLALGYIHREIFTGLYIIGAIWPSSYGISFLTKFRRTVSAWALSCLVMGIFTLLPANKVENIPLIMTGGFAMLTIGMAYLYWATFSADEPLLSQWKGLNPLSMWESGLLGTQIGLVALAMIVTHSSATSLQAKQGLPRGNQIVGWIILGISLALPLLYRYQARRPYTHLLIGYFLTFAPTFVILSLSYEGLFYVAFSATLLSWVKLEQCIQSLACYPKLSRDSGPHLKPTPQSGSGGGIKTLGSATRILDLDAMRRTSSPLRPLTLAHARVSLFFFVLLQSAFFSTGNVASISSFSLESVYRLIPIFDPFSQGALLILKLLIPFALISAHLGVLNQKLGVAPSALFMIVMAISDILTLYFFWVVKDEGSWLEIGSTISHFVIASLLCIFVAALEGVTTLLVVDVGVDDSYLGTPLEERPQG
jgi:phosphatidylinositol glycan class N